MNNPAPPPPNRDDALLDAPLIALTNQCGGDLRRVLGAFFSFLHRRTDFYLVPHQDDVKTGRAQMGFRQGDAEKVLLASFRQFPLRRLPKVGESIGNNDDNDDKNSSPAAAAAAAAPSEAPTNTEDNKSAKASTNETKEEKETLQSTKRTKESNAAAETVRLTKEGLQEPVGNGGTTERYKWTQTLDECSVLISVPENTRGKDLDVTVKASSLTIKLKTRPDIPILVDGTLTEKVVPSESTWTIEGGVLIVVLYKHKKAFWSTIIQGDDKIDTSLVDSRRKIDDYDEATQAQIRKIIFDQNQARRGLSSSDEIVGKTPEIPTALPPGVEYINQEKLDQHHEQSKKG